MSGILSRVAVSMAAAVAGGTTWLVVEPGARSVAANFIGFELGPTRTAAADAAETATVTAAPISYVRHPDANPSFNCDDATSTIEHVICSDPAIAEADRLMNKVWGTLSREQAITEDLRTEQRQWLNRRDACLIDTDPRACVRKVMLERITKLSEL